MLFTLPAVLGKFVLGTFVPSALPPATVAADTGDEDSKASGDGGGGGGGGGGDGGTCCKGGFTGNFDDALIVGVAMVARGELGFVMAQQSRRDELMDDTTYAACKHHNPCSNAA